MPKNISFHVVIPARYASSRLPAKVLLPIAGKPMVQHVYERAKASGAKRVIIATDNKQIFDIVQAFGGEAVMTAEHHQSGTDRIAEAIEKIHLSDSEIIVNVQGDEPLIEPLLIKEAAWTLAQDQVADIATFCEPIIASDDLANPNIVKVVRDEKNYALYFSRSVIPWQQRQPILDNTISSLYFYRHIGLYAYTAEFIRQYVNWSPCVLEQLESLEQLRALWYGAKVLVTNAPENTVSIGVDTEADLIKVETLIQKCRLG
jgi:3-deoxy-manno-octulosonate cytidylyltransferase (CMP-KDO synthetase)